MNAQQTEKAWFNALHGKDVPNLHNGFYDVSAIDWVKHLESNWQIIRDEGVAFMGGNSGEIRPYFDDKLVTSPGTWKSFSFFVWGKRSPGPAIKKCPKTMEVLKGIPDIVSASISIMEPNSKILAHKGDTNTTMRCHLGLIVPAGLPDCGFHVEPEEKGWEAGKMLAFNDASYHYAWNNTPHRRVILLVDVIRPEFSRHKLRICVMINTILVSQYMRSKFPPLRKLKPILYLGGIISAIIYFPILYLNQKLYFK